MTYALQPFCNPGCNLSLHVCAAGLFLHQRSKVKQLCTCNASLPAVVLLLLLQLFWFIPSRMLWRVTFERLTDALSDEEAAKVRGLRDLLTSIVLT
jgi:hypothetical protein